MAYRYWRQRLDPAIPMVFRRPVLWEGHTYQAGDPLPATLVTRRDKLRTFWENQWIEHAPVVGSDDSGGPETPSASPESAQSPAVAEPPARDGTAGGEPTGGEADQTTDSQESSTDTDTSDAEPPLVNPDLLPAGATVERRGVAWFIVTLADGTQHKANGKARLEALLAELNAKAV